MANLPQIVRERLQAAAPVGDHPEADALTAFCEQSLPATERATVLEHLARCGDCRDIVALALAATEDADVTVVARRRGWLTWPVLRWGFVAAGVVVIASLGVVISRQSSPQAMMPSSASPRLEVAKEAPVQPPAAETSRTTAPAAKGDEARSIRKFADSVGIKAPELKLIAPEATSQTGADVAHFAVSGGAGTALGQRPHGPGPRMPATQFQVQNNNQMQNNGMQVQLPATGTPATGVKQNAQPATMVPQASETVEVTSQAPVVTTETQVQGALRDEPARPQSSDKDASTPVGKAKAATTAGAASSAPMPTPPSAMPAQDQLSTVRGAYSERLPRWTISSAGALQRSFDQGNTWQDVDVNTASAYGANISSLEVVTKTARAKEEKDADKKTVKAQPITFRAVSALGADVWAGGSGGVLYHSPDAGLHWSRVVPASGAIILRGDISSLEFSDPQNGKVTTSAQEVWTTSNNGQTWQKQ